MSQGVRKKPQATLDTHVVRQTRNSVGTFLHGTEDTSSQDQDMSEADKGGLINPTDSKDNSDISDSLSTSSKESEAKNEDKEQMNEP